MGTEHLDGVEDGIDRTVAGGGGLEGLPSTSSSRSACCGPLEPAITWSETKRMRSLLRTKLSSTSATMSSSKTSFFLSAKLLEATEGVLQRILAQIEAQLLQFGLEGMAAGMLAHHQGRAAEADGFRSHDLVGAGMLQHAVLMDARFMGEGIGADDRLVGLDRQSR